ncbi:hypothetical protein ACN4EE_05515 [Geminocystis sp. CENA526]|uniref:hypothetical protein n=1 Tax=Geminocystis sp. CENA526 TaxID=1355871 RepID=UPI003D6F1DFD
MVKRNKKTFVAYLNPNLVSAFDSYCSENKVLKSEILSMLLLEFLLSSESLPEKAKKELYQIKNLDEILAHKLSPKTSLIQENEELKRGLETLDTLMNQWHSCLKKIIETKDSEIEL